MKLKIILTMIGLLQTTALLADLKIIINDAEGDSISTISRNYKFARIDNRNEAAYLIIDLKSNQFTSVDPVRKVSLVLNDPQTISINKKSGISINLQNIGKGPLISGFDTQKYSLSANGQSCQTIFGSQEVMKLKGINEIFTTLSSLSQQTSHMMGGSTK